MRTLLVVALCAFNLLAAHVARAQNNPSIKSLIADGFEIKNVSVISLDAAKRVYSGNDVEGVVITLQRKNAIAVCYFVLANWVVLRDTSIESTDRCDMRNFGAP